MKDSRFRLIAGLLMSAALLAWAAPAAAQLESGPADLPGGGLMGNGASSGNEAKSVVAVQAEFTAPAAGKPGRLFITATIDPGWHIYSITQPTSKDGNPTVTTIDVKRPLPKGVRLTGPFKPSVPPLITSERAAYGNLPIEEHTGAVTWYTPIELDPGVDLAKLDIRGTVSFGACNANSCLPPQELAFTAELGPGVNVPDDSARSRAESGRLED